MAGTTNTDAEVTVGISGEDALIRAAQLVGDAWRTAGQKISNSANQFSRDVLTSLKGVSAEVTNLATRTTRLNLTAGADSARQYGLAVSRMAYSAGKDVDELKRRLEAVSRKSLMPDSEALALANQLRAVTHSADFAVDSIQGIADGAENLGQSPQQVAAFAASLYTTYGVSKNVAGEMESIDAIARAFGTTGGPAALREQMQSVDGIMSRFKGNARESAALVATLGVGLSEKQAAGAAGSVLGGIASNRLGAEWLLRGTGQLGRNESILNDKGEIGDQIGVTGKVKAALIQRYGAKRALQVARMTFGDIEGTALMNFDAGKAYAAANQAPTAAPDLTPAAQIRGTDEARQTQAEIERARNERKAGGWLARQFTGANEWFSEHPILGTGIGYAATKGIPKILAGAGARLGIGGAAAGTALSAGASVLGAGAAGYGVGSLLDDWTGASDWLSGTGKYSKTKEQDDRAWLASRSASEILGGAADGVLPKGGKRDDEQDALATKIGQAVAAALAPQGPTTVTVQQKHDGTVQGVKIAKAGAGKQ